MKSGLGCVIQALRPSPGNKAGQAVQTVSVGKLWRLLINDMGMCWDIRSGSTDFSYVRSMLEPTDSELMTLP